MTHLADELLAIHRRLLAGDPTASADLFRAVHHAVGATVYRQHRAMGISWDDARDLSTDAIVAYVNNPAQFDPTRSGLATYLVMIARGDALNLAASQANKKKSHSRFVELTVVERNERADTGFSRLDAERIVREHGTEIIREHGDEAVLRLFLSGEDATEEYAKALGASHLAEHEQRQLVKQRRDRIEKRLQRLGLKL